MPDYMTGNARRDLLSNWAKFDDPVTGFKRRPLYSETVHHLLVMYASESVLRAAESKIKGIRQLSNQRAVEFHSAIKRTARRYGSAFPLEDII